MRERRIVTRLQLDERVEPSLWYAVTVKDEDCPRALFQDANEAIQFGKDHLRAKHSVYSVELRLSATRQNPATVEPATIDKANNSSNSQPAKKILLKTSGVHPRTTKTRQ